MKDFMSDHGLDKPIIRIDEGELIVTLPGPGDDLDRIRTPKTTEAFPPSVENQLNKRQKAILQEIVKNGSVTTGWCKRQFKIVQDTAVRDLKHLCDLSIIERQGKGRSSHYIFKQK